MPFKKRTLPNALDVRVGNRYGTIARSKKELAHARAAQNARHHNYKVAFDDGSTATVPVRDILYVGSQRHRKRQKAARLELIAEPQPRSSPSLSPLADARAADRDGAVGDATGTFMEQETVTDGQRWRRARRQEMANLVKGPFTLGGEPMVECVHCAAMLWPMECSRVYEASIEATYFSMCCDVTQRLAGQPEHEVEAVLARRLITTTDHCFFTGDAFEYKLKWKWWPVSAATWQSGAECAGCDELIAEFNEPLRQLALACEQHMGGVVKLIK